MQEFLALVDLSMLRILLQKVKQGFKAWRVQHFVLLFSSKLGDGTIGAVHASTGR